MRRNRVIISVILVLSLTSVTITVWSENDDESNTKTVILNSGGDKGSQDFGTLSAGDTAELTVKTTKCEKLRGSIEKGGADGWRGGGEGKSISFTFDASKVDSGNHPGKFGGTISGCPGGGGGGGGKKSWTVGADVKVCSDDVSVSFRPDPVKVFLNMKNAIEVEVDPPECAQEVVLEVKDPKVMTFKDGDKQFDLSKSPEQVDVFGANVFGSGAKVGETEIDVKIENDGETSSINGGISKSYEKLFEQLSIDEPPSLIKRGLDSNSERMYDQVKSTVEAGKDNALDEERMQALKDQEIFLENNRSTVIDTFNDIQQTLANQILGAELLDENLDEESRTDLGYISGVEDYDNITGSGEGFTWDYSVNVTDPITLADQTIDKGVDYWVENPGFAANGASLEFEYSTPRGGTHRYTTNFSWDRNLNLDPVTGRFISTFPETELGLPNSQIEVGISYSPDAGELKLQTIRVDFGFSF